MSKNLNNSNTSQPVVQTVLQPDLQREEVKNEEFSDEFSDDYQNDNISDKSNSDDPKFNPFLILFDYVRSQRITTKGVLEPKDRDLYSSGFSVLSKIFEESGINGIKKHYKTLCKKFNSHPIFKYMSHLDLLISFGDIKYDIMAYGGKNFHKLWDLKNNGTSYFTAICQVFEEVRREQVPDELPIMAGILALMVSFS